MINPIQITLYNGTNKDRQIVDFSKSTETILKIQNVAVKLTLNKDDTESNKRMTYALQVNGRHLSTPGSVALFKEGMDEELYLAQLLGSIKLKFRIVENLLKIEEIDEYGKEKKTTFWVDPNHVFCLKGNIQGIYDWKYRPLSTLKKEEVLQKCEVLQKEYPQIKFNFAFFNRHGIATWGWDNDFAVFYCNPTEDKIKKRVRAQNDLMECVRWKSGGIFTTSWDRSFSLTYKNNEVRLNDEVAEKIDIKST